MKKLLMILATVLAGTCLAKTGTVLADIKMPKNNIEAYEANLITKKDFYDGDSVIIRILHDKATGVEYLINRDNNNVDSSYSDSMSMTKRVDISGKTLRNAPSYADNFLLVRSKKDSDQPFMIVDLYTGVEYILGQNHGSMPLAGGIMVREGKNGKPYRDPQVQPLKKSALQRLDRLAIKHMESN